MPTEAVDLAIVGAGPAGMSAACEARDWGLSVALFDEQAAPGGQIYRAVDTVAPARRKILGEDYARGAQLTAAFARSGALHLAGASVWNVGRDLQVNYVRHGTGHQLVARKIILASGAMERPFPIHGWTLPGVMGAGAAQILFKASGAVPTQPVVLAGCGPLLYLLARQYLDAGVKIKALVLTTHASDYVKASRHAGSALRGWRDLQKGLGLLAAIRRARVPVYAGVEDLRIEGTERAEGLSFGLRASRVRIDAPLILLHQGVVPNTQLSFSLGVEHRWDTAQLAWHPETDAHGQLADTGIYVAGDSRGIVGAMGAALQGRLAAVAAVAALKGGRDPEHSSRIDALSAQLRREVAIRPFLDVLYRPKDADRMPSDDAVVVCRCEEVTAGQIRKFVDLGCTGPNQAKAFGRCGMGPCQGRLCGLTVTELIAQARGVGAADVGHYRIRPPIKPVSLGELAGAEQTLLPVQAAGASTEPREGVAM